MISVPAGSNLTNQILTNVGNIENKGLEFSVSMQHQFAIKILHGISLIISLIMKVRLLTLAK